MACARCFSASSGGRGEEPYVPRSDRRQFVLAIDLGSSGPKVALVADDGGMVAHVAERVDTFFLPGGGAEQDPDQWWRACTDGVRKVLEIARPAVEDVIGVTCTAVGHRAGRSCRQTADAGRALDGFAACAYTRAVTGGLVKVAGYGARKLGAGCV